MMRDGIRDGVKCGQRKGARASDMRKDEGVMREGQTRKSGRRETSGACVQALYDT